MADDYETSDWEDGAASRVRFAGILDAFAQAWRRGPNWEARYGFAGRRVHLRVAAQIGRSAAVCALALPRIANAVDTRLRPASKKDVLLTMARSSIFIMRPRGGRDALEALTRLAQEVPVCWLEVGHDLEQIPRRIDEILAGGTP